MLINPIQLTMLTEKRSCMLPHVQWLHDVYRGTMVPPFIIILINFDPGFYDHDKLYQSLPQTVCKVTHLQALWPHTVCINV